MNHTLVLGATGNVGTAIVDALVRAGVATLAASRGGQDHAGARGVRFDFDDDSSWASALEGVGRIYIMLPPGQAAADTVLARLIELSARRGCKIVLQSSTTAGLDADHPQARAEIWTRASGAPFVIVRPCWFMDNFHIFWADQIRRGELALSAGESRSALIDIRDIADAAVAALTSSVHDGGTFSLTGGEAITYREATAILSRELGFEVRYRAVSDLAFRETLIAQGMAPHAAGYFAEAVASLRQGSAERVFDGVLRLTGQAPRAFADYAAANRSHFLPAACA